MVTEIESSGARTLRLLAPFSAEQGLHLLDSLTWFPASVGERVESIARYMDERCTNSTPTSLADVAAVLQRLDSESPADQSDRDGRWVDVPRAKVLYQLKYDLKHELLRGDWFTFMNMGYAEEAEEGADQPEGRALDIWQDSGALYVAALNERSLAGLDALEVGSGRGGGAALLTRTQQPRSYIGIDLSPANVDFCTRVHHVPDLSFAVGDAERLEFDDESFDAVVNIESAHCYPNPGAFFREVFRVLRPGGRLYLADEWWADDVAGLMGHLEQSELVPLIERDITSNILIALDRLNTRYPSIVSSIENLALRDHWTRFFRDRVCRDSRLSYASGRFVFLSLVWERPP